MHHTGTHERAPGVSTRVQALTARNLQLLQAIESTLGSLANDTQLLRAITGGFEDIQGRLESAVPHNEIDPTGTINEGLCLAASAVHRMHARAEKQHASACCEPLLTPDDGVADAYSTYLTSLAGVFDSIEHLRDWICTHDAILQPSTGKTYVDVDDLFSDLLS